MQYVNEIQRIEIKKLYNSLDVSFDLTRDCTILIGENGIGKTTALKILQHLLEGNFVLLARFIFESIWITVGDRTYKYRKEFFEIPADVLLNKYIKSCPSTMGEKEYDDMKKQFEFLLVELVKCGLFGEFLYCLVKKHYSSIIRSIVETYIEDPIFLFNIPIGLDDKNKCYLDSAIYESEYKKVVEDRKRLYWNQKAIFGDMVNNVQFSEEEYDMAAVQSFYQSIIKDTQNKDKDYSIYHLGFLFDEINQEVMSYLTYKFRDTGLLDINLVFQLLYYFNYNTSQVISTARKGERQFIEALNNKITYSNEQIINILDRYNENVYYIHEYYVRPFLPANSPYRTNLQRSVNKLLYLRNNKLTQEQEEIVALLESYINVFDEFERLVVLSSSSISKYIQSFQDIISLYITDKEIRITPKGILFYSKPNDETSISFGAPEQGRSNNNGSCFNVKKIAARIPLNSLSSGERKIIALAFYSIFADHAILIMDEPELSVSILWQERLLVDLLDYGNFNSIIIATHSPYIARDDSLSDYIEYLP